MMGMAHNSPNSKSVTVVISDLNMLQMSGFEFLSVVRRRFPQPFEKPFATAQILLEAALIAYEVPAHAWSCPSARL